MFHKVVLVLLFPRSAKLVSHSYTPTLFSIFSVTDHTSSLKRSSLPLEFGIVTLQLKIYAPRHSLQLSSGAILAQMLELALCAIFLSPGNKENKRVAID
jgi:hypothetical protein